MLKHSILLLSILALVSSCKKEDPPLPSLEQVLRKEWSVHKFQPADVPTGCGGGCQGGSWFNILGLEIQFSELKVRDNDSIRLQYILSVKDCNGDVCKTFTRVTDGTLEILSSQETTPEGSGLRSWEGSLRFDFEIGLPNSVTTDFTVKEKQNVFDGKFYEWHVQDIGDNSATIEVWLR